jgi:hypothetical protein
MSSPVPGWRQRGATGQAGRMLSRQTTYSRRSGARRGEGAQDRCVTNNLTAHNPTAATWHNGHADQPVMRLLVAYDH